MVWFCLCVCALFCSGLSGSVVSMVSCSVCVNGSVHVIDCVLLCPILFCPSCSVLSVVLCFVRGAVFSDCAWCCVMCVVLCSAAVRMRGASAVFCPCACTWCSALYALVPVSLGTAHSGGIAVSVCFSQARNSKQRGRIRAVPCNGPPIRRAPEASFFGGARCWVRPVMIRA